MKNSISYSFNHIANAFWVRLEKLMFEIGLHAGQVFILSSLWENDGQSQAELVRDIQVSPPTITNMVARMAESGFVEARKCSRDGRLMRVFLTDKGRNIKPEVELQWLKLEEFMLSGLTETEKMMFSLLLEKINSSNLKPF